MKDHAPKTIVDCLNQSDKLVRNTVFSQNSPRRLSVNTVYSFLKIDKIQYHQPFGPSRSNVSSQKYKQDIQVENQ